jgi:hypothetical protein
VSNILTKIWCYGGVSSAECKCYLDWAGISTCRRQVTRMGNKSPDGPFTPLVIVVRNVMGKKDFNQLRGKAISLHSQGECRLHAYFRAPKPGLHGCTDVHTNEVKPTANLRYCLLPNDITYKMPPSRMCVACSHQIVWGPDRCGSKASTRTHPAS